MTDTFTITQAPLSGNLFIYPMGDNTTALQIYPTTPATHYDKVNEDRFSPNDDSKYVFGTSTTAILDLFNLQDPSASGTINYVQIFSRGRAYPLPQAATGEYKHKIVCGSGNALSPNYAPLTTTWQNFSTIWTQNPATSAAWTWADINALVAGLSVSSPLTTGINQLVLNPNAAGIVNTFGRWLYSNYQGAGDATNYTYIDEINPDDLASYLREDNLVDRTDLYNIPNHTTETGVINWLRVYFRCAEGFVGCTSSCQGALYNGSTYQYGTEQTIVNGFNTYYNTWTTNPFTAAAWTWPDIDTLQIGICSLAHGLNRTMMCTQVYAVVNYGIASMSPDIRCTQLYVMVNYSPSPVTITLLSPNEVTFSNSRKIERTIFPDGTYIAADIGRSMKKMTLKGTEITTAIQKMRAVQTLLGSSSTVTLSGLLDTSQDTIWRLSDFNFEYDPSGDHYDWTMDLTSYDVI